MDGCAPSSSKSVSINRHAVLTSPALKAGIISCISSCILGCLRPSSCSVRINSRLDAASCGVLHGAINTGPAVVAGASGVGGRSVGVGVGVGRTDVGAGVRVGVGRSGVGVGVRVGAGRSGVGVGVASPDETTA